MTKPLRMGAAAAIVSASILVSRLLGLLRDVLLAGLIGVSTETDLYNQAFALPDYLNYLLAGAFLTITLIPILSRHLADGDEIAANKAFSSVFRFVGFAITGLTVAIWVLAEPLIDFVFPKASDPDRLVSLTRLVLPAQVFLVLGALLMAVQYARRRFLLPALAPIIYNLGIICGGLIAHWMGNDGPEGFLIGAVIGAALGNFALQWLGAKRAGMTLVPVAAGESSVREYLSLALPLMLGQSVAVLDEQFVRLFGQLQAEATAALQFARRLNMVPIGLIAQAAGVAAFPFMARLWAKGDEKELTRSTTNALQTTLFLGFAATASLVVTAKPLVRLVYQYGRFEAADSDVVTTLLRLLALSVPAWAVHQIIARYFYAKRKMWIPVVIGTIGTLIAAPTWLILYDRMGVSGFALASTISITIYALMMFGAWGRDVGFGSAGRLGLSTSRGLVGSVLAIGLGELVVNGIANGSDMTAPQALVGLVVGAVTVLAVFLLFARLTGAPELTRLTARWGRSS